MLLDDVSKYLSHKIHLAETSPWYKQASMQSSIQWAYSMQQFLRFKGRQLREQELALMLRPCTRHLENLVPSPNNKSYKSSIEKLNQIINRCREVLQPKKQQENGTTN